MKEPIVSIVIPTYIKSANLLSIPFDSVKNQKCPRNSFEVIIADNKGGEPVKEIAQKYNVKIINVGGKPPRSCYQVNAGVGTSKGKYVLLMDHDISIGNNFISELVKIVKQRPDVDAWYVPYKIIARGKLMTAVRNFEEKFYYGSVIAAARIIKKDVWDKTEYKYDPKLTAGPADWDLTIQLKRMGAKIEYFNEYFFHHEEMMTLWQFLTKRITFSPGAEKYKNKWKRKDKSMYNKVVKKQYSAFYRLVGIFFENGRWKMLLPDLHLYVLFLVVKISTAAVFLVGSRLK